MEDASGRASNADPRGDSLSGDDFDDRPTIGQQEPTRLPPSTTIQAKKRARVEHIVSNIRVPTYTENAGRSVVLSPRSFDRMVEPEVGKEDHGLGLTRGDGERRSKRKQVLPQQHDTGDDRRSVDEDLSDDDDDDNDDDDDDDGGGGGDGDDDDDDDAGDDDDDSDGGDDDDDDAGDDDDDGDGDDDDDDDGDDGDGDGDGDDSDDDDGDDDDGEDDDDDDDDDRFRTASSREQPDDYDDQVLQQQLRIVQCRLEDMYAKYVKSLHANDTNLSALHTPHDNINPSSDSKMCSETERLTSLFKV